MVHLARAGGVHPVSLQSLRDALFSCDTVELPHVEEFSDVHPDWNDLSTLDASMPVDTGSDWLWHNPDQEVTGPTWGGNLEILHWNLAAARWIQPVERYAGSVLLLETSEEMPSAVEVHRMLRNAGERGLLAQFGAVVLAKPKAWSRERPLSAPERATFRTDQYQAVLRAMGEYSPGAMVVCGPDFGHTDPQVVLPYGGRMSVDGVRRRISVTY